MAELDVADYCHLSAENYDTIESLARDLSNALISPTECNGASDVVDGSRRAEAILNKLHVPEYQDTLSAAAAICAIQNGDWFSPTALGLHNRHKVRNNIQYIFHDHMFLIRESSTRQAVEMLYRKLAEE